MHEKNPSRDYHYETQRFFLRQVQAEDAPALLCCYSDPEAVARMNADNCLRGFLCRNVEELQSYLAIWQSEDYARPAVIDKSTGMPVGTLEIFGGETGVLRVDLCSEYEKTEVLRELYALALERFPKDFPMGAMVTKAPPSAPARREVLAELGFSGPEEFRGFEDYYRLPVRKLGIARCGLACCLCSENADCPGCGNSATPCYADCKNFGCCDSHGVSACWECPDFPCETGMLGSLRIRTFAKFAKEYGVEKLLECLERNRKAGVVYHSPGKLTGDYDLETQREIFDLLLNGKDR